MGKNFKDIQFKFYGAKRDKRGRGTNSFELPVIDDIVILVGGDFADYSSPSNPFFNSKHACSGRVLNFSNNVVDVLWDNGIRNSYSHKDLGLIENEEEEETRSIFILNSDIMIGDLIVASKGTRMLSQGDYIHDQDGDIFIKIKDKKDFKRKKIFTRK